VKLVNKNIFREEEVISFLEGKVLMNSATQDELELYEDLHWMGSLVKNDTYKKIVKQMNRIYLGGF
jgi:hypothetical protein